MSDICSKCGAELNNGAKFCPICGEKQIYVEKIEQTQVGPTMVGPTPVTAPAIRPTAADKASIAGPTVVNVQVPDTVPNIPRGTDDNKGLRIGLSFVLAFFAICAFTMFFWFFMIHKATSRNYFVETIKQIDINETTIGSMAKLFGKDDIDEDSTIAEAIASVVADAFEADIEKNELKELLGDEAFSDGIGNIYGDIVNGVMNGQLNLNELSDDLFDFAKDNRELISQISGEEITKEDIDQIKEGIGMVREGTAELSEVNPALGNIASGIINLPGEAIGNTYEINKAAAKEARGVNKIVVYMILAFGVAICGIIIVLNRKKLSTGFRFTSIIGLLVGLAWMGIGAAISTIPKGVGFLMEKISAQVGPFASIVDSVDDIIKKTVLNIADGIKGHSGIFIGVGGALLIASIIFTVLEKQKEKTKWQMVKN